MLKTTPFLRNTIFFNTFLVFFSLFAFQNSNAQSSHYGAVFEVKKDIEQTSKVFKGMTTKDSMQFQIKGMVTQVCQAKGCWMNVDLADGEQVFVKFKDYGFFVPTNSAGKEVVMNGLAFIEEMSVEEQRHYAMDKGATKEEAAKINQPKRTLRFEADGVRFTN